MRRRDRQVGRRFPNLSRACRLCGLRVDRLAIPLGIGEMMMRLYEIVNGEVVLAVAKPRAAAVDLLELDHRIDRAHQDDVAHVAGIDAGGQLL